MNNFEWLVKTGRLSEFIHDSHYPDIREDVFSKKWDINFHCPGSYSDNIVDWLQQEHKEPPVFINLKEAIRVVRNVLGEHCNIYGESLADNCEYALKTIKPAEVQDLYEWLGEETNGSIMMSTKGVGSMTNLEKLIHLLTEQDGKVKAEYIKDFVDKSPLQHCNSFERCDDYGSCNECIAKWLNEESKEKG